MFFSDGHPERIMVADSRFGLLALNRFGLGGRADGDLAAASGDPRGFLLAELAEPGAAWLAGPDLPATPAALKTFFAIEEANRLARLQTEAALRVAAEPPVPPDNRPAREPPPMVPADAKRSGPSDNQVYRAEAFARLRRAATVRAGFVERLVAFWSNHFCVSAAKGGFVRISAGAFEREAIRPHVTGRFADMLLAVESHPAMIFYLDNHQSAGANSPAGRRPNRGLNENLAREILELHTLGVDGGYTQADVRSLANIISGWTFAGREEKSADPGSPFFLASYHEPGPQVLLGQTYAQQGRDQGEAALHALARHPATARHIATKFARHFVADDPPASLVAKLSDVFIRTDGDLAALATALVKSDEAWTGAASKMRDPWQFVVASMRMTGIVPSDANLALGALAFLGQPLWSHPGPNGFSDLAAAWATPEGMRTRLDLADRMASRVPGGTNPVDLLDALAGNMASPLTRQTLARAASRAQGLTLLLMSPEMQRR